MASPGIPRFALFIAAALVFLLAVIALQNEGVDNHCRSDLSAPAAYPDDAKTEEDFLKRGDAAFDRGNCKEAIAVSTQALALNPDYAEAYNNRAYSYMQMRDYAPALQDLDQALRVRPDYLHALMNRGDIHNYYFEQDRRKAIDDYDHILRLGGQAQEPSVCGHRAVAIYSLPGPWRMEPEKLVQACSLTRTRLPDEGNLIAK
jgi:tetratricopeptide (TPR) repeat protein